MKKYVVALTFLISISLLAQQQKPQIKLQYDLSRFRGYDNQIYVEVYYSFNVSLLGYKKVNTSFQSEALMSISFKRSSNDSIVAKQMWRIPFNIEDTTMLTDSRSYVDVFGFLLDPDIYRLYLVVSDINNPSIRDSVSILTDIQNLPNDNIALSDIELATSIIPTEKDSTNRYYKNTFEVRPNPSKIFGEHQPVVFYYLEAYNLNKKVSQNYYTKAVITNAVGKEVINHEKIKRRANESNVEVGKMQVNTLKTGAYTFTYTIIDSVDSSHTSTAKRFFVYNPSLPLDTLVNPSAGNVDASEYATMNEAELDKEFEQSKYVATAPEIDQYKKLSGIAAKRKSLFEFWGSRDEDRTTPFNENKQEYFRRVAYANTQYKTGFREGWKTDRGRVYIVYGTPDEVERHANETDSKPYEVWYYNSIQGGVQFIFGDRTGFSDYVLLHSTHRNELQDPNWQYQLRAN
jgi:GWxTD domain-containing protein